MSIKQKLRTAIIIVICIMILITIIYFIYEKLDYTLSEVEELLNSPKNVSNMHITIDGNIDNESTYTEIFMKDNFYYVIYKDTSSGETSQESFYNPETSELIDVDFEQKGILETPDTSLENLYFLTSNEDFTNSKTNATEYKYLGKEDVNGKKCLKVRFTREDDGIIEDYYYIDLEDNNIIKYKAYSQNYSGEFEKTTELTYTYTYDNLTDNDVKKFDIDDYPDYLLLN